MHTSLASRPYPLGESLSRKAGGAGNRLDERLENYLSGDIHRDLFETQLNSWLGHARQADTWRLRWKIFWYIRGRGLNLLDKERRAWKLLELPRPEKQKKLTPKKSTA